MAEKNVAYLVREDTKTIGVRFFVDPDGKAHSFNPSYGPEDIDQLVSGMSPKEYSYVTNKNFKVGDLAVVKAAGQIRVAYVSRVDTGCDIEPNSSIKYSWVIDRVDSEAYEADMAINDELEATVNKAYKQNVKNQFRAMLLGSLDEQSVARITALTTGGSKQ